MRIHPGVGSPLWRINPKGGATICGYFIPEGIEVGMNAWAVHQDKKVFGEDAIIFRPERWLDADPERLAVMDRAFFSLCSRSPYNRSGYENRTNSNMRPLVWQRR